jgi:hypothetical protein
MKGGFCLNQLKKLNIQNKKVKIGLKDNYLAFDQNYEDFYTDRIKDINNTDADIPFCLIVRARDKRTFNVFITFENDRIQLLCFHFDHNDEKNDI